MTETPQSPDARASACPFCGGIPEFDNTDERARLRCTGCGTEGGLFFFSQEECESGIATETEARAIAAWNQRAALAATPLPVSEVPWTDVMRDIGHAVVCKHGGYRTGILHEMFEAMYAASRPLEATQPLVDRGGEPRNVLPKEDRWLHHAVRSAGKVVDAGRLVHQAASDAEPRTPAPQLPVVGSEGSAA